MCTSEEIKNRMLQILSENTMDVSNELQIFEAISNKYEFKTISDYAKIKGLSYNGVLDGIKRDKIPSVIIGKTTFCFM